MAELKEDTIAPVTPIEVAQRESVPTTHKETVFDVRDLSVLYGKSPAIAEVNLRFTATW